MWAVRTNRAPTDPLCRSAWLETKQVSGAHPTPADSINSIFLGENTVSKFQNTKQRSECGETKLIYGRRDKKNHGGRAEGGNGYTAGEAGGATR